MMILKHPHDLLIREILSPLRYESVSYRRRARAIRGLKKSVLIRDIRG